jgi:ribosome-binding protein aMBF1 (putative translation factor)
MEPAYKGDPRMPMISSLEVCPSCNFQFGYHDDDQHITHEQWRQKWIAEGMVWDKGRTKPPPNWNSRQQLLNIGIKVNS